MSKVYVPEHLYLFDYFLKEIQMALSSEFVWLDGVFGKSQKMTTERDKRKIYYPGFNLKREKYISLFPDERLGNFCFFVLKDPYRVEHQSANSNLLQTDFELIFWYNRAKIGNNLIVGTEEIKTEVLKFFNRKFKSKIGRIKINQIFEEAKNIYSGFDLEEIKNQYLMFPFSGFKITGDLIILENDCYIPEKTD